MNPLATNLALYLSIDPSALYFTEYKHLQPTGFFSVGRMTNSQLLFLFNASISRSMVCFHFLSDNASNRELGVVVVFRLVRKALCVGEEFLKDRKFDRGRVVV